MAVRIQTPLGHQEEPAVEPGLFQLSFRNGLNDPQGEVVSNDSAVRPRRHSILAGWHVQRTGGQRWMGVKLPGKASLDGLGYPRVVSNHFPVVGKLQKSAANRRVRRRRRKVRQV